MFSLKKKKSILIQHPRPWGGQEQREGKDYIEIYRKKEVH